MTDEPDQTQESNDQPIQLNPDLSWRRSASQIVGIIQAQNTLITLLLEKLVERNAITQGDAFSLLEECLALFPTNEAAQVPLKTMLGNLRKRFVPPPGSH